MSTSLRHLPEVEVLQWRISTAAHFHSGASSTPADYSKINGSARQENGCPYDPTTGVYTGRVGAEEEKATSGLNLFLGPSSLVVAGSFSVPPSRAVSPTPSVQDEDGDETMGVNVSQRAHVNPTTH